MSKGTPALRLKKLRKLFLSFNELPGDPPVKFVEEDFSATCFLVGRFGSRVKMIVP